MEFGSELGYERSSLVSVFTEAATPSSTADAAPQNTILESLAGDRMGSFVVEAAPLQQHVVSATQDNASAQVDPNMNAIDSVQTDIKTAKAAITSTIQQAQGAVIAAAKAAGHDAAAMYPDNRWAANNEVGVFAHAVMSGVSAAALNGLGSMATFASKAANVESVLGDNNYPNRAAAESAIKDILIQSSSAPQQDTRVSGAMAMGEAEPQAEQSGLDCKKFFEEGHELSELMSIDAENPQREQVPEYGALQDLEGEANDVEAQLNLVREETEARGDLDNETLQADKENAIFEDDEEPEYTAAAVYMHSGTLADILGTQVIESPDLVSTDVKTALIGQDNELDPRQIGLGVKPAAPMVASGNLG